MSYLVSIVRTHAGKPSPLTLDEISKAVSGMGGRLALEKDGRSDVLVLQPELGKSSEIMWYADGELTAKNPSPVFLQLMIELGNKLGARVRGDEYETYRTAEETYQHPDDMALIREQQALMQKYSRKGLWNKLFMPVFMVIGLYVLFQIVRRLLA